MNKTSHVLLGTAVVGMFGVSTTAFASTEGAGLSSAVTAGSPGATSTSAAKNSDGTESTPATASSFGAVQTNTTNWPNRKLGHRHCGPLDLSAAAKAIGVDQATLIGELRSGKSIADVAQSKGVAEQIVLDALQTSFTDRLHLAVQNGKLTSVQADQMKAKFLANEKQMVEHKGFGPGMGMHARHRHGAMNFEHKGSSELDGWRSIHDDGRDQGRYTSTHIAGRIVR